MGRIMLLCILFIVFGLQAQTSYDPTPKTPQVGTFQVITPGSSPTTNVNNVRPRFPNHQPNVNTQIQQYENDRRQVQNQREELKKLYKELRDDKLNIRYSLPSYSNDARTNHFYRAFDSLLKMNPDDFSIKDATFIIENAFYENTKSYAEFDQIISNTSSFIKEAIEERGYDPESNLAKNLGIYQFISDTLTANGKTHLPYTYDFEDYMGRENWDNMFVYKLINNGSGQCNSMPRLYQILAEELGADSKLAFAPNHSFIRFQDNKGEWHNAELTSGAFMTDIFMLDSGFIKSETVLNGNYMVSQTNRQVMAQLLNDLASGYISKFGADGFAQNVINKSLELNPTGINTNLHKINYQIAEISYVMQQLGVSHPSQLGNYPKAKEMLDALVKQDRELKQLGYEEMPKERYEAWLSSLKEEKAKNENKDLKDAMESQKIIKN